METAKLRRKVQETAIQVIGKKLTAAKWTESIGMSNTNTCPLCTGVEDNEHRVKQCP